MILTLFAVLVTISIVLVVLGLTRPTESYQAVVGFFLLFLLSLTILNGNLEYESGAIINTTISYTGSLATSTDQTVTNQYSNFNDATSRRVGYYLAVVSAIGMIGVFFSLRKGKWGE